MADPSALLSKVARPTTRLSFPVTLQIACLPSSEHSLFLRALMVLSPSARPASSIPRLGVALPCKMATQAVDIGKLIKPPAVRVDLGGGTFI